MEIRQFFFMLLRWVHFSIFDFRFSVFDFRFSIFGAEAPCYSGNTHPSRGFPEIPVSYLVTLSTLRFALRAFQIG